jgi:hypothetical protein
MAALWVDETDAQWVAWWAVSRAVSRVAWKAGSKAVGLAATTAVCWVSARDGSWADGKAARADGTRERRRSVR